MSRQLKLACAASILFSAVAAVPAHATESGSGIYLPGVQTIDPGTMNDGLTAQVYSVYYYADTFKNSSGDPRFKNYSINFTAQVARFQYVLPQSWTPGFHVGMAVMQPFYSLNVYRQSEGASTIHNQNFGPADTILTPLMVGNSFKAPVVGEVNQAIKLTVNLLDGQYNDDNGVNPAHHYWAFIPSYGIDFHPNDKTKLGLSFTYSLNGTDPYTQYRSGQETITEFDALRRVTPKLWVGVNGAYFKQISADKQNGVAAFGDGFYGREAMLGPQIEYHTKFGGITFKWQHEFMAQNRPQGDRFWVQASVKL